MTPAILYLIALVLALVSELQAEGKSLIGWAVTFVCVGLLFGWFKL